MTGTEIKVVYPILRDAENYLVVAMQGEDAVVSANLTPDQIDAIVDYLLTANR